MYIPRSSTAMLRSFIRRAYKEGATPELRHAWADTLGESVTDTIIATANGERVSGNTTGGLSVSYAENNTPMRSQQLLILIEDLHYFLDYSTLTTALAAVPPPRKSVRPSFINMGNAWYGAGQGF